MFMAWVGAVEVCGRGEGHAREVLQGPGFPGAELHRQGRQARVPVPVSIHEDAAALSEACCWLSSPQRLYICQSPLLQKHNPNHHK
jgi:hypothetical protein